MLRWKCMAESSWTEDSLYTYIMLAAENSANSMKATEQFYQFSCQVCNEIQKEWRDTVADHAFQILVKAVIDTGCPDNLVLTLLVYISRNRLELPHEQPLRSSVACATALWMASVATSKLLVIWQLHGALRASIGSDGYCIYSIPPGCVFPCVNSIKIYMSACFWFLIFLVKTSCFYCIVPLQPGSYAQPWSKVSIVKQKTIRILRIVYLKIQKF